MLKRYLAALLSFVLSLSCFSYVFFADSTSTAERSVDLYSYQADGSYSNNNDTQQGIYSVDLMKSTTITNKLKIVYTVDPMSDVDDIPETIKLFIPNSVIATDAMVETNNVSAVNGSISVSTNGDGATVSIPISRSTVYDMTSLELTVPFTLNLLSDPSNAVVTLVSYDGQSVAYNWSVTLTEVDSTATTLKERLNANTKINADSLSAIAGMHYVLPLRIQSTADEKTATVRIENEDFYFKLEDGTWSNGYGEYTVTNITAGIANAVDVEVFCMEDTTTPFTLYVDGEQLTSTLPVEVGTISLVDTGADTSLPVGTTGKLNTIFKYDEPLAGNNTFKFNFIDYDSSYYTIDTTTAVTNVNTAELQASFSANYTPVKAYNAKNLTVNVTQEFQDVTYTLASKSISLTALEESVINNDIEVNVSLGDNNTIILVVANNGDAAATANVNITISTDKIHIVTDDEVTETSSGYVYTTEVDTTKPVTKVLTYTVDADCNTTTSDKNFTVLFSVEADDNTSNNNALVDIKVAGVEAETVDYSIVGFGEVPNMNNGQTKQTYVRVENTTETEGAVTVTLKVSDASIKLSSSMQTWEEVDSTTYSFSKTIAGNTTVDIPFAVYIPDDFNDTDEDAAAAITAEVAISDGNSANNKKTLSIVVLPDESQTDDVEIDLNDYFTISLDPKTDFVRLETAIVALTATQTEALPKELTNGHIEIEVIGDVAEQPVSGNYIVEKDVDKLDISTIATTITFTPTNVGNYRVKATVSCDDLVSGGTLTKTLYFTLAADSGAYPSEPIISSEAVNISASLSDIVDNEGTLTVTVTNTTDYILRDAYLNFSYGNCINIKSNGNIIRDDLYIGNVAPNSTREYTYDVEVLSDGSTNIVISFDSEDLNTDVYQPAAKCNKDVTYTEEEVVTTAYSISGTVFNDADGNAVYSVSEDSIANATVYLKELAGNILQSMRTYSSGYYIFSGLDDGTYVITAEYLGSTVSKTVTVESANLMAVNMPLSVTTSDSSGSGTTDGGSSSSGTTDGSTTTTTANANVSISSKISAIYDDYYVLDVTVSNNSQIATWATVTAALTNAYMREAYEFNAGSGIYQTDSFYLAGFSSKSFTVYVGRGSVDGTVGFTVNPITDTSSADNYSYTNILAIITDTSDSSYYYSNYYYSNSSSSSSSSGSSSSGRKASSYDNDIADFSPSAPYVEDSANTVANGNEVASEPASAVSTASVTPNEPASETDNGANNVPTVPKTGELQIERNPVMAVVFVAGLCFLCCGVYILTDKKKVNCK